MRPADERPRRPAPDDRDHRAVGLLRRRGVRSDGRAPPPARRTGGHLGVGACRSAEFGGAGRNKRPGLNTETLALGAITKPWVHHAITPALESLGLPHGTANVVSFVLALFIVTFLHLVIGEMAPKSWALAHPEFAATALALPMRAFMVLTRPMLRLLNGAANALVRRAGVEPVDEISIAGDPQALRALVEHSANVGALEASYSASITRALTLADITLQDMVAADAHVTAVSGSATIADVQEATLRSGHLRVSPGLSSNSTAQPRSTRPSPACARPAANSSWSVPGPAWSGS